MRSGGGKIKIIIVLIIIYMVCDCIVILLKMHIFLIKRNAKLIIGNKLKFFFCEESCNILFNNDDNTSLTFKCFF